MARHAPVSHEYLVHWLTGVVFSALLSAAVVFASGAPFVGWIFQTVETAGIDASMRLRSAFAPDAPIGAERTAQRDYVFLDLDPAFCDSLEASRLCESRSPASPSAAALAAVAAIRAQARVVAIDVRLWDATPSGRPATPYLERLAAAARASPTVRVVAVAPSRELGPRDAAIIEPGLIPEPIAHGEIRFAPAYALSSSGVVRNYPATVLVRSAAPGAAPARQVPSLPYLAALYSRSAPTPAGWGAIDCFAWADPEAACGRQASAALTPSFGREARPLFTLPGLAVMGPSDTARGQSRLLPGLYEHYAASNVVGPDGTFNNPELVAGRVVVIGASAKVAGDRHPTPIGVMTGAELVVNMIRAFSADAVLTEPSTLGKILREWIFVAVGSLPFLAFWWLALAGREWITGWLAPKRPRLAAVLATAPAILLFVPTVLLSGAIMIAWSFMWIGSSFLGGHTWDLFTPLAALSLEGFAHASIQILATIEHGVILPLLTPLFGRKAHKRGTIAPSGTPADGEMMG